MGLPCLFTRQQALILGYFYLVRVKNSNPLLTELSLCYSKHTKFYLEHKTSFIQISSIASFNSFLIAWLWGYCTFSHSPRLDPNTPNAKLFSPKKLFYYHFSSSNMLFIRLFSANTCEKKSGVTELVSLRTAVKGGHGFEIAGRMDNLRGGDWGEIQNNAHRVRTMHSRSTLIVFDCFYVYDIANTEIQT